MAGCIDPDPQKKPVAAPPSKPATAQPAAAGARPAPASRPAGPPPAASQAGAKAPQRPAGESRPEAEDDEGTVIAAGFLKQMPAWAISMLVHVVALLAMALISTPPPQTTKPRAIQSSAAETDQDIDNEPEEEPLESTDQAVATDMVVPTDVAMVEDVQVIANADDVEAAPMAVEFTDFGTETAPAADMMATIGAGGTAPGGLGGRANAAARARASGGGDDTEKAVDRALKWLIEHQLADGSWSFDLNECPKCRGKCTHSGKCKDRAGATALALLPFLGRGRTHKDGPYQKEIERGLAFLAAKAVQQGGAVYAPDSGHAKFYVQGLAGIVLSESYGMTQDRRLAQPAQLVLDHITKAQDQRGGGWRYGLGDPGDTSVAGWQIMALKSGHMAYLKVNPLTVKKAVDFLNSVQSDEGATYGYMDGSTARPSLSAVGLLCRMYLGWKKENPALQDGVKRLAKLGPNSDIYYDYYATQVMHHMEGDAWKSWNDRMKPLLLKTQSTKDHEAGSWFEGVNGSGHASEYGGRLYCTSLATMILEVYYRHLPIYGNQSVNEEFKE